MRMPFGCSAQRARFLILEMPDTTIFSTSTGKGGVNLCGRPLKTRIHSSSHIVPSLKTEAYADLLQMLKVNPPKDCTEPECEPCRFRRELPVTPESLLKLAQFCLQY